MSDDDPIFTEDGGFDPDKANKLISNEILSGVVWEDTVQIIAKYTDELNPVNVTVAWMKLGRLVRHDGM